MYERMENTAKASQKKRLREEMGFTCEIKEIFSFLYHVKFDNNLVENEYDHVFVGTYDGEVIPDGNEVEAYKWVTTAELKSDIISNPHLYTFWFKSVFNRVIEFIEC